MSDKYAVGTRLMCGGVPGTVVQNVKLPGDICVMWPGETRPWSYSAEWLDENVVIQEAV